MSRGGIGQRKKEPEPFGTTLMVETSSSSRRFEVGLEEVVI